MYSFNPYALLPDPTDPFGLKRQQAEAEARLRGFGLLGPVLPVPQMPLAPQPYQPYQPPLPYQHYEPFTPMSPVPRALRMGSFRPICCVPPLLTVYRLLREHG